MDGMEKAQSDRKAHNRKCRFRKIDKRGIRVAIEVTHKCNLNCDHCFVLEPHGHPTLDKLQPILEQLKDINCRKVIITGGEPLIRDDLEQIVSVCAGQGLLVDLNSNFYSLKPSRAESLLKAGVSEASVSIYGDEAMHDKIVGMPGAYRNTLNNLKTIKKLGIEIDVHSAIYSGNSNYIEAIIKICEDLKSSSLTFFTIIPILKKGIDADIYKVNHEDLLEKIGKLSAKYAIPVNTIGMVKDEDECNMCCSILGITAHLELKPCLLAKYTGRRKENILNSGLANAYEILKKEIEDKLWIPQCTN